MSSPHHATTFPPRDAFVACKDDAPAYWFYDTLWVILADVHQTGGSFSVIEQWMRAGVGPPLHVHNVDEWFFVFSGSMDMQVGARKLTATGGTPSGSPAAPITGSRPPRRLTCSTVTHPVASSRSSPASRHRPSAASCHRRILSCPPRTHSADCSTTIGRPSAPTPGPRPHPNAEAGPKTAITAGLAWDRPVFLAGWPAQRSSRVGRPDGRARYLLRRPPRERRCAPPRDHDHALLPRVWRRSGGQCDRREPTGHLPPSFGVDELGGGHLPAGEQAGGVEDLEEAKDVEGPNPS